MSEDLIDKIKKLDENHPLKIDYCLDNTSDILTIKSKINLINREIKHLNQKSKSENSDKLETLISEKKEFLSILDKKLEEYEKANCNSLKINELRKEKFKNEQPSYILKISLITLIGSFLLAFTILTFGSEIALSLSFGYNYYSIIGLTLLILFVIFTTIIILYSRN